MFASNFPVDSLCGSFDDIYGGFKRIVADLPYADQERLFHSNARRIYRTVPDTVPAAGVARPEDFPMNAPSLPRLAMVLGDPAGIGPELIARLLADTEVRERRTSC